MTKPKEFKAPALSHLLLVVKEKIPPSRLICGLVGAHTHAHAQSEEINFLSSGKIDVLRAVDRDKKTFLNMIRTADSFYLYTIGHWANKTNTIRSVGVGLDPMRIIDTFANYEAYDDHRQERETKAMGRGLAEEKS